MDSASRRGEDNKGLDAMPHCKRIAKNIGDWIKKIINHFKTTHAATLEGHLGPLMKKHLEGLQAKRRSMEAIAHGEKPNVETRGAFKDDLSAGIAKPAYVPKTWWERQKYNAQMLAAKAGTLHSATIKSGESFGLDHPTTEKLGRELRNQPVYRQKIFQVARIADLSRAFKDVGWHQRASVSKQLSDWVDERAKTVAGTSPKQRPWSMPPTSRSTGWGRRHQYGNQGNGRPIRTPSR
jgi:hypothetical protein